MTDLRTEAMKMALEALEVGDSAQRAEAVIALSDALAQPEQVLTAKVVVTGVEQEPVAWINSYGFWKYKPKGVDDLTPLYTAPPNLQEMLKQAYLDGVNSGLAAIRAGSEK